MDEKDFSTSITAARFGGSEPVIKSFYHDVPDRFMRNRGATGRFSALNLKLIILTLVLSGCEIVIESPALESELCGSDSECEASTMVEFCGELDGGRCISDLADYGVSDLELWSVANFGICELDSSAFCVIWERVLGGYLVTAYELTDLRGECAIVELDGGGFTACD